MIIKRLINFTLYLIITVFLVIMGYVMNNAYNENSWSSFYKDWEQANKIEDKYWDEKYENIEIKNNYKVVLITNFIAEYTYGQYFKYSAERMGWKVEVYYKDIAGYEKDILAFDPDFIIFFQEANPDIDISILTHRSKKYLSLFSSLMTFKEHNHAVTKAAPYMLSGSFEKMISMVHGITSSATDIDMYRVMFDSLKKPFNGFRMLSTVPSMNNEPAEPNNIIWIGTGWDAHRKSNDFKRFINLLSQNTKMKAYGRYKDLTFLAPDIYDGFITPGMDNIEAIRKNGIYLLTHSKLQPKTGEPGMRIFEAIAANVVIISDKHPWAIKNFGDNFLYFDQTADPETMYKQVKTHYDWIKANPEKAKEMANQAHKIFLEKFTIERDLIRFAKMHEYVVKQERELSYQLIY